MTALIVVLVFIILLLCYKVLDLKRELRIDHALADSAVAKYEAELRRLRSANLSNSDIFDKWEI